MLATRHSPIYVEALGLLITRKICHSVYRRADPSWSRAWLFICFGADASLDRVRRELAKPCHRLENSGTAMRPGCRVDYPDLRYGSRQRPDLPPGY